MTPSPATLPVSSFDGGGIYNSGTLTLTDVNISGNEGGELGGGIYNTGTLTLTNDTVSGFALSGGGIYNTGTVSVSSSTITGILTSGHLTLTNSTISGIVNSANLTVTSSTISGGGIVNSGNLAVNSSTIAGNSGGIHNTGTLTLQNTIVAGNTANSAQDISGSVSGSNNLIGIGTGETGLTNGLNGNLVGTSTSPIDPMLGPLADNGGPTQTMALLTNSPAIGAGAATAITTSSPKWGTMLLRHAPQFWSGDALHLPSASIQIDGQQMEVTNVGQVTTHIITVSPGLSAAISAGEWVAEVEPAGFTLLGTVAYGVSAGATTILVNENTDILAAGENIQILNQSLNPVTTKMDITKVAQASFLADPYPEQRHLGRHLVRRPDLHGRRQHRSAWRASPSQLARHRRLPDPGVYGDHEYRLPDRRRQRDRRRPAVLRRPSQCGRRQWRLGHHYLRCRRR